MKTCISVIFANHCYKWLILLVSFFFVFFFELLLLLRTGPWFNSLCRLFQVINFSQPVIIHPQKTVTAFYLKYHPNEVMQHFKSKLILHTNASVFEIPLTVYNAQLKVSTP